MAEKSASASVRPRPLSPHVQIWRWSITMASSILHRMTGVALAGGAVLVVWWLYAVAMGPEAYQFYQWASGSIPGMVVLAGFTWSLSYHLMNGIRHLFWDVGYGFAVKTAEMSGRAVFVLSFLATAAIWAFVLYQRFVP
ncbi:MAG: succinate dehydrogenase, cytochrome b556 subunit [Alphaproteobacteria bacterium]|nr:succinate dehydrogenase, cytochrome b556 subunit [Alphaproteobacteria bacterium]